MDGVNRKEYPTDLERGKDDYEKYDEYNRSSEFH